MIYLSVIPTSKSPGMISANHAVNYFHGAFPSVDDAKAHLVQRFLPDGLLDEYDIDEARFVEIVQLCLKYKHMIYSWHSEDFTTSDARLLHKHILNEDWRRLFEKNHEFYLVCLELNGQVHVDSLSDDFIREHYYLVAISDIKGIDQTRFQSLYDWIRSERPQLFEGLEEKLLQAPGHVPDLQLIVDEYKSWISADNNNSSPPPLPEPFILARKSQYYGQIKSSTLVKLISDAACLINSDTRPPQHKPKLGVLK